MATGTWPPVYDYAGLEATITQLRTGVAEGFFEWFYAAPVEGQPPLCQGDLIVLDSALVFLDGEGQPTAGDRQDLWAVLGNSCDLDRDPSEIRWTQLLPAFRVSDDDTERLPDLRSYRGLRVFYFPPERQADGLGYLSDFTRPVTVDRQCLCGTSPEKRLSYKGWLLFHACLVRYLARQDGRNDF